VPASSTLAGQLIRHGVARAAKDGKVRPLRQTPVIVAGNSCESALARAWGVNAGWRAEMWGQIVALHGRYPRALAALKDKWWTDDQHTEMLCALAVWRSEIDDAGQDPREELVFHTQLAGYAHTLRQQGGVTKTWESGAPPAEWAGG
jgi:hypothetical protein